MEHSRRSYNVAAIGVVTALALLILFGVLRYDRFLSLYNVTSVLRYNSMFALVALGSVLALAGVHNGARVPAATKGSCASLRQYRVVTGGNVLAAGGEVIATVVAGDLFDAATTHGTPYYAHRYYGTVLRTGVWGYVDSKKLQFVKDTCFP